MVNKSLTFQAAPAAYGDRYVRGLPVDQAHPAFR
jgi:hypothetical protein